MRAEAMLQELPELGAENRHKKPELGLRDLPIVVVLAVQVNFFPVTWLLVQLEPHDPRPIPLRALASERQPVRAEPATASS